MRGSYANDLKKYSIIDIASRPDTAIPQVNY